MKYILLITILISPLIIRAQNYSIPEQQISLSNLLISVNVPEQFKIKTSAFEMSRQITLGEYKEYLESIKKDSGEIIYNSMLPDTSIGTSEMRKEYFESGKYDAYPVVGISWDNALRYCKWLTLKNNKGKLETVYRLPNLYEYYAAYIYMQQNAIENDLNILYSDWLMDSKDESLYAANKDVPLSFYYFHLKSDVPAMKRKVVIGQSFKIVFQNLEDYIKLSFYAESGYSHIGFRIVKDTQYDSVKQVMETTTDTYLDAFENPLLNYWNLKPSDL